MQTFPHQKLDDGREVYFGQPQADAEKLFGTVAADIPIRIARPGTDKIIALGSVSVRFDTEKLVDIGFLDGSEFRHPPAPFADPWMNFEPIHGQRIHAGMLRDDFTRYIDAWGMRAVSLGARKIEMGDLKRNQFSFHFNRDEYADMFHANMGPSRRAGGGGIWSSGWTAFFAMESDARHRSFSPGQLMYMHAFCDDFNTVARGKA